MKKIMSLFGFMLSLFLGFASQAYAAIDLTGVVFPMTSIESVAALILAAAASIWVIYKVLSLIRRG